MFSKMTVGCAYSPCLKLTTSAVATGQQNRAVDMDRIEVTLSGLMNLCCK